MGRNSAFERQIDHFESQRQEYNQKIDKLQSESLDKDRQIAKLQLKMERIGEDFERKKSENDFISAQYEKEKKNLSEKLDQTKKKLSET